ncbi:MAG TPA: hypothetical protein VI756_15705, partial [Blastocatellia bacterium]
MTRLKRKFYLGILALAMVALAVPVLGIRTSAWSGAGSGSKVGNDAAPPVASTGPAGPALLSDAAVPASIDSKDKGAQDGKPLPKKLLEKMGISLLQGHDKIAQSVKIGQEAARHLTAKEKEQKRERPQSGEPQDMQDNAAFSAAFMTNVGGRSSQFDEVLLLADWNGQEQFSANHSGKVDDFSGKIPTSPTGPSSFQLTRTAVSEHTIANGFTENIFYYGDSFGNVYVSDETDTLQSATPTPNVFFINLPTALNAFGSLNSDDQVVVTGLAVSPVCDLTSFANVNGNYASFTDLVGEILYVTFEDTESGFNLTSNGTLVRSGVLAFPVADIPSAAPAPPGIVSPTGFPVQVGGAFGVAFSVFSNEAGCSVDDDGSLYFQQVDLLDNTGANIIKITSTDLPGLGGFQDRSLATSGFQTITSLTQFDPPPAGGGPGTASGPSFQVNTFTDYSGVANLFGNIEALASGPCNNLYASVARSLNPSDTDPVQVTEGPYSTSSTALGPTPTMVIRFSDVVGAFAPCTLPTLGGGVVDVRKKGEKPSGVPLPSPPIVPPGATGLPIGDGVADVVPPAGGGPIPAVVPGVNNFIVFVEGDGPDIRVATGGTSPVNATTSNT